MVESLVTTIIPTYQRAGRLKRSLESVLSQSYPHFRLCIYDNGSEDETEKMVKAYVEKDARIHYFRHACNIGAVANFQFGMDRIETPFFSFLSDDDYLEPEFYENAIEGFEKYPDALFSYASVVTVDDQKCIKFDELALWENRDYFISPDGLFAMAKSHLNWTGILFRKEVIEKVGPLDPQVKPIDLDYLLRVCAHHPFAVTRKRGACFVSHESSYSYKAGLKLVWPSWQIMMEKIKEDRCLPQQTKEKTIALLERRLCNDFLLSLIRHNIKLKKFEEAKAALEVFDLYLPKNREKKWLKKILICSEKLPLFHFLMVRLFKLKKFLRV